MAAFASVLRERYLLPLLLLQAGVVHCANYVGSGGDDDAGIGDPLDGARLADVGGGQKKDTGVSDSGNGANDAALDPDAKASSDASDAMSAQGSCTVGFKQVGEYATWGGKVNVHRSTGGAWSVDSDCTSGANINTVTYCQKFWPGVTTQVHLMMVTPEQKPFTQGGGTAPTCGGLALNAGVDQFVCCAP